MQKTLSRFTGANVASATQFDREAIEALIQVAYKIKELESRGKPIQLLTGKVLVPLFYEDSTRTFSSFCAAMTKLGGSVVYLNIQSSSVNKGETLSDTVRSVNQYADVVVLRHPQKEALTEAISVTTCPVMNAGNGTGEHPTQALLDTFTMHQELGESVDGKHICLVGDLKHGRTVHSLTKLLCNFQVGHFSFVSPPSLAMPQDICEYLTSRGVPFSVHDALTDDVLQAADVLYVTRVQKERFANIEDYKAVKGCYIISKETLPKLKAKMCIMHPLPRVDEITVDVDADPRAAYFRQMKAGLHMRMAILSTVLGKIEEIMSL